MIDIILYILFAIGTISAAFIAAFMGFYTGDKYNKLFNKED